MTLRPPLLLAVSVERRSNTSAPGLLTAEIFPATVSTGFCVGAGTGSPAFSVAARMTVPTLASAFSVYLFRNFFLPMPPELEDAASIDGAGRFRTFWSVALPVARPAMIAGAILLSTNYWNAFLWPLLVVFTESMKTLPVGMAGFTPGTGVGQSTQFAGYAPAMAAMTILTIPSILVFLFLQRQFIEGATSAGIKG